jgi:lipopolysaccharide export system permease protein
VTLLDRYIFRSALFACLAAMGVLAFVVAGVNIIRDLINPAMTGQISLPTFIRLVLLMIPYVFSYALPLGMLTGILLTLSRLSADSEITAMRASGVSVGRIALPVVILGLIGATIGLPVNFESMPKAKVQYEREFTLALRANPLNFIVPKTFIYDFPGFVIYVGGREGEEIRDTWIWTLDNEKRAWIVSHAHSGHIAFDEKAFEIILTLRNVQAETMDAKLPESFRLHPPNVEVFENSDPTHLPLSQMFSRQLRVPKLLWLTYEELRREKALRIAAPVAPGGEKEHARSIMDVSLTIMEKFNTALAALSFAIIGVPLGIKVSRRETSANLGIAAGIAVGYYFLTVAVGWVDRRPELRPDLLIWIPNLLVLATGIILFQRLDRAKG